MDVEKVYGEWLKNVTADERACLEAMPEKERADAFYCPLAFGTAGMRGVIGMGTNRMNFYTVARATKGLASFITSLGGDEAKRGVVLSYDTRRYSAEFAIKAAKILAAAGIKAYLYESTRPVPMCSFAIRHLNAVAGVMITASHNPKEYNGYKVYGEDGAQMSPENTDKVVKYIDKTPYFGICEESADITPQSIKGLNGKAVADNIFVIGADVDRKYFEAIEALSLSPSAVKELGKDINIVYTPIHGSGYMPVSTVLKDMGISVNVVKEQACPDPDFSTVRVPNPEERDTLKLGVELAQKIGSDLVIGTDPDADRMGVAVRDDSGNFILLNGNQIGSLLLYYILSRKKEDGALPSNGAVVKTIVTTQLARKIADSFNVVTFDVLTGFKFIGEKIKEWEQNGKYTYLFGFEESYGSLVGTHARDKDAVVASMMFAEMSCYLKKQGKTPYDALMDIYRKYDYFSEATASVVYKGADGMSKMATIMKQLRCTDFDRVNDKTVVAVSDYLSGITTYACGKFEKTDLPSSDAIKLHFDNGDWVCIRPSGTEPKLKFYASASAPTADEAAKTTAAYLEYIKALAE